MRFLAPIFLYGLAFALVGGPAFAQIPGAELTAAQWQQDVDALVEQIEQVHQMPWFRISREEFLAAAAELRSRMLELSPAERVTGVIGLVARLSDGHSSAWPITLDAESARAFPVRFYRFEEGLFILAIDARYPAAAGGRVLTVGGVPAAEAFGRVLEIAAGDNDFSRTDRAQAMLSLEAITRGLHLSGDEGVLALEIETPAGERLRIELPAVEDAMANRTWDSPERVPGGGGGVTGRERTSAPVPRYLQRADENFWFERSADRDAVYIQFNRVRNAPDELFADFVARLFADLDAHQPPRRVILDLRLNGGGNNTLLRPLIHGFIRRPELTKKGQFLVLISRQTFSAAMSCAAWLERHVEPVFVGEPSGASPNHPGDNGPVSLPNSRLFVRISRYWWLNTWPWDRRPFIAPHWPVPVTAADFFGHRDPTLELALSDRDLRPPVEVLAEGVRGADPRRAIEAYRQAIREQANPWRDDEEVINRLGYELRADDLTGAARTVFELNTRLHPDSANVWDSLAELYMDQGDLPRAIELYEKAIEIDPGNNLAAGDNVERMRRELESREAAGEGD